MMRIEEFILKRKTEDGINEYDREKRAENTRICVDYVYEYFNAYLETAAGEEKTVRNDKKIAKYAVIVRKYSAEVREWLIDIYTFHGKYLQRTLPTYIKDPYFLLYDSEAEFRAMSDEVYPKALERYKFLEGHTEMIYLFLKDRHRICSLFSEEGELPYINESIDDWVKNTYMEHGVNIYSFCDAYLETFLAAPDKWPEGHKKKSKDYDKYRGSDLWYKVIPSLLYDYDYTQKDNLFGLDTLYRNMPKKSFVDGKKQELEAILMYYYCCEWNQLEQYWEEYSEKLP